MFLQTLPKIIDCFVIATIQGGGGGCCMIEYMYIIKKRGSLFAIFAVIASVRINTLFIDNDVTIL